MWWIRHNEAGYHANVVGYYAPPLYGVSTTVVRIGSVAWVYGIQKCSLFVQVLCYLFLLRISQIRPVHRALAFGDIYIHQSIYSTTVLKWFLCKNVLISSLNALEREIIQVMLRRTKSFKNSSKHHSFSGTFVSFCNSLAF